MGHGRRQDRGGDAAVKKTFNGSKSLVLDEHWQPAEFPYRITVRHGDNLEAVTYIPLSTCHMVDMDGTGTWECDRCGAGFDWDDPQTPPLSYGEFCPRCGAMVVEL